MKQINTKIYKLAHDLNRHNKIYLHEDRYSKEVRRAKKYAKENNVACGAKITYSTGVRTYKNFGVYDVEKPNDKTPKEPEVKEKPLDETKVAYNYIKLMMSRNK